MNVKPGDIAIIAGLDHRSAAPYLNGRIVHVLSVAPTVDFVFPDGKAHTPASQGCWIIRFVDGPAMLPHASGRFSSGWCAVAHDRNLRRLHDPDDFIKIITEKELTV